mmetsp:Transcript_6939/g.28426  ORF Transcript_6939/g.28426 Transcript_6939/m.28426 type:complete len:263 (+) Transcript_6939:406-1194(+)
MVAAAPRRVLQDASRGQQFRAARAERASARPTDRATGRAPRRSRARRRCSRAGGSSGRAYAARGRRGCRASIGRAPSGPAMGRRWPRRCGSRRRSFRRCRRRRQRRRRSRRRGPNLAAPAVAVADRRCDSRMGSAADRAGLCCGRSRCARAVRRRRAARGGLAHHLARGHAVARARRSGRSRKHAPRGGSRAQEGVRQQAPHAQVRRCADVDGRHCRRLGRESLCGLERNGRPARAHERARRRAPEPTRPRMQHMLGGVRGR